MAARITLGMVAAGAVLLLVCVPLARAAEGEHPGHQRVRGWSVVLYFRNYAEHGRARRELSGVYPSREECEDQRSRFVVLAKGGQLRCDWINELRPAGTVRP